MMPGWNNETRGTRRGKSAPFLNAAPLHHIYHRTATDAFLRSSSSIICNSRLPLDAPHYYVAFGQSGFNEIFFGRGEKLMKCTDEAHFNLRTQYNTRCAGKERERERNTMTIYISYKRLESFAVGHFLFSSISLSLSCCTYCTLDENTIFTLQNHRLYIASTALSVLCQKVQRERGKSLIILRNFHFFAGGAWEMAIYGI